MEYALKPIGITRPIFWRVTSPIFAFFTHLHDHVIPTHRNNYHPHLLGHRSLALFSILLVSVKIFTLTMVAFGPVAPAFSAAINSANIITLTNESRSQYGLSSLKENELLRAAAQAKAEDMLAKGYFAHNAPDGKTPWDFIVAAGYNYLQAGENLAVNFTEAEDVEAAWMNSPGHKANILNKNFQEIGIGIAQGQYQGHDAIFVVQEFGVPAAQKMALNNEPTKVQNTETSPALVEKITEPTNLQASPKVNGENSIRSQEKTVPVKPEILAIDSAEVISQGSHIQIKTETLGPVTKVLAYFGGQAIMLSPKDDGVWEAEVALSKISMGNQTVKIVAYDMQGNSIEQKLADFAASTQSNFNLSGTTANQTVNFFGVTFNPHDFENKFYLMFIAGLLTSLVVAIAIKRHIQHIPLIANSSFVAMFATLLWWIG